VLAHLRSYSVKIARPGEEFALASGGKSRLYIDAKRTTLHRTMHQPIARLLRQEIERLGAGIDAVAGVVLGGAHLASLAASHAPAYDSTYSVVFVRHHEKDHGTRNRVEAAWSPRLGDTCVVIEDVLSTGSTMISAIAALREALFKVVGVVALVDRRPDRSRTDTISGVPLRHVFNVDHLELPPDITRLDPAGPPNF
jgi:orotate phosphoribosyltransferase